jgi:hypothetical protein
LIELPDPGGLFAALLFGVIGLAAFNYGRKRPSFSAMTVGVTLMVYPYFVSRTWLVWTIGAALCAALYVFRDF